MGNPGHEEDPVAEFGSRVRSLRKASGKSQELFAANIGVHRTYVGAIERGERNVSLRNLIRIAEGLAVDPSRLVQGLAS